MSHVSRQYLSVDARSVASKKTGSAWLVPAAVLSIIVTTALTGGYLQYTSKHLADNASVIVSAKQQENQEIETFNSSQSAAAQDKSLEDAVSPYPLSLSFNVESGDTLVSMLTEIGVSSDEANDVVRSVKKIYDLRRMDAGRSISVDLDQSPEDPNVPIIKSLILPMSVTASLQVSRNEESSFAVKKIEASVERRLARAGGEIKSSLYETGASSGLPASMLAELINAYSYDVDFQRDVKQGDALDVLYERLETEDGTPAGYGNLVYAELELGDRNLRVYRYADKSGNVDYYNEKGESVRKALLRTPINGARITSGFGMRVHPLLGYTKMHRGMDFGAAIGTPIYAAGDGTVEFVGRKNGYGNYLRLKHNDKYASAYAHISRFASGMSSGRKVKQGQIIAYVGNTGNSTGPHLHYEILVNGDQVNPNNMKFKTGNVLQGKELAAFKRNAEKIQAQLDGMPRGKNDIAMNVTAPKKLASN